MACGVLVIEDDPELREMMAELLRIEGFDPVLASNGLDALTQLRIGPRPHVIVLDLMMPVMDGWQFRQQQQSDPILRGIPVIVATAAPLAATRDLHADLVLQKPLNFEATISAIRRYC
jgi:CheY-like chemotaxis protein